jgi:hypothetical protein
VEEIKNLIQSFSKKIFRFPMLLKKYSDLGGGNNVESRLSTCMIVHVTVDLTS